MPDEGQAPCDYTTYKSQIAGFTYDKEADCFTCPAGKQLLFKRFASGPNGRLSKRYSVFSSDLAPLPAQAYLRAEAYVAQDYPPAPRRALPPVTGAAAESARTTNAPAVTAPD